MATAAEHLPCYLVEWYLPGVDESQLRDVVAAVERSSPAGGSVGSPVRCVLALVVPVDEVIFGVFAAGSADDVEDVCRRARVPASRVSVAVAERDCS